MAAVYNGTSLDGYVDGVLVASVEMDEVDAPVLWSHAAPLSVGRATGVRVCVRLFVCVLRAAINVLLHRKQLMLILTVFSLEIVTRLK